MAQPQRRFDPLQAQLVAESFNTEGVDFLFIGKGAAIIMGYPAMTQDVDLFLPKDPVNGRKAVRAIHRLGFDLTEDQEGEIIAGKDFIQLKSGPFDLDLVHAPDGLPDYQVVKERSIRVEQFPLASLRDIIASKEASGREKDLLDLHLLKQFQQVYDQAHPSHRPLRSSSELPDPQLQDEDVSGRAPENQFNH